MRFCYSWRVVVSASCGDVYVAVCVFVSISAFVAVAVYAFVAVAVFVSASVADSAFLSFSKMTLTLDNRHLILDT